ncbi:MAG: hypothetical protein ACYDAN_05860 [Candidatus Limnocylindrales bacterium]
MTTSTTNPIAATAGDALDAIVASAAGRARGSAPRGSAPIAFESVLAAETDATEGDGAANSRPGLDAAAREPRQAGRPDVPGATDPQPDHGRDDQHAVGRSRSHRGREAAETRPTDDPQAADAGASHDGAIATDAGAADPDGTGDQTRSTGAVGSVDGHRRPADPNDAVADPDPALVAAAVLTPAVAGAQLATKPEAKSETAGGDRSANASAATPATPASPAVPAGRALDGVAAPATPATPAVPSHEADGAQAGPQAPMAPAHPVAAAPGAGSGAPADGTTVTSGTGGGEARAFGAPAAPGATAPASATPASATVVPAAWASASSAAAASNDADPAAPARRVNRGRGAPAAGPRGDGMEAASAGGDPILPATASDVARARASIARIVAAGADDAVGPRHHLDGAAPPAGAVPAANVVAGTPAADTALAAIAAARQGTPAASSAASTSTTTSASVPAADRLAFEALDRIRTTVTAGVPGLESRIEDPELGTIRIVVSARLGETIRAEIIASDPAAARELTSGIDRALAAGAALPGNVDLRVRAEAAAAAPRADAHPGHGGGEHARPQDWTSAGSSFGGRQDGGADGAPGRDVDRVIPAHCSAPAPAHGRTRGLEPVPVAASSDAGALRPGTALDVRA